MNGSGGALSSTSLGGASVMGVTVGDFNADGRLDIAAAGNGSSVVHVYLNQGPTNFPTFTTTTLFSSIALPVGIVSKDLDGDSDLDLAIANSGTNTVAFYSNNGTGVFSLQSVVSTGGSGSSTVGIDAGDLDRDGDNDVVVTLRNQNQVQVLPQ